MRRGEYSKNAALDKQEMATGICRRGKLSLSKQAMSAPRRILHLDMDAFFASVELLRRPDLKGKPVIVGGRGDPTRRGVVTTATYEARGFGVRSGMPLRTAARLCPGAVYLPMDFAEYARWSRRFKAVMKSLGAPLEDRGIDEAFLDITELPGDGASIARDIKRRIFEETGLACSIGIAPNKLLAKIASELDKPDGLTVIGEGDLEKRIWPLEVRRIPGVGPKANERLAAMGIRRIGELALAPRGRLASRFGRAYADFLHDAANGRHDRPFVTGRAPKSHSRETTFQEDTDDRQAILRTLTRLAEQVARELRDRGYAGRTIGIKLRYADFETLTRDRALLEATNDPLTIRAVAVECLARVSLERKVRLLGVRVGSLLPAGAMQSSLDLPGLRGIGGEPQELP